MKHETIDKDLFIKNREKLKALLKPNAVVLVYSNDIMPTNGDGTMPFRQNSNLLYLSGIDQEESVLMLAPDYPDPKLREVLFLRETSEMIATWEGHKYSKAEAQAQSGIETVMWNEEFGRTLQNVMAESACVYLDSNEHIRRVSEVETRTDRFVKWCHNQYPLFEYERLYPLLSGLRPVKEQPEIDLISHACKITERGFRRVLSFVKPGTWEFEVEAEYLHEFVRNRSRGFAYEPIVAGGGNSCVLHYVANDRKLETGDLLLMDVGAEYAHYNADMTRVIPACGWFTPRQRKVYKAVLRVKKAATEMLVPGNNLTDYNREVGKLVESELLGLGLIDRTDIKNQNPDQPAYKTYFMHGTSHHLGLDVHDVGSHFMEFVPGMVLTVEPGIYIPDENIGIRLEDNVVIRESGPENLMANIPIEEEEIEELMHAGN